MLDEPSYELLWLEAFVLTCAIEIPIYALVLRRALPSLEWRLLLAFGVQVATHPALWFVVPQWRPYGTWVLVMELCVFSVEALLVAAALRFRPTLARALGIAALASFAANLTSTLVGFLV
ncbi:MAG: hypothetical protein KC635_06620 [Myxococcales bacterium]|nr:hypothetical protein [Myxococcales bacterium]